MEEAFGEVLWGWDGVSSILCDGNGLESAVDGQSWIFVKDWLLWFDWLPEC